MGSWTIANTPKNSRLDRKVTCGLSYNIIGSSPSFIRVREECGSESKDVGTRKWETRLWRSTKVKKHDSGFGPRVENVWSGMHHIQSTPHLSRNDLVGIICAKPPFVVGGGRSGGSIQLDTRFDLLRQMRCLHTFSTGDLLGCILRWGVLCVQNTGDARTVRKSTLVPPQIDGMWRGTRRLHICTSRSPSYRETDDRGQVFFINIMWKAMEVKE